MCSYITLPGHNHLNWLKDLAAMQVFKAVQDDVREVAVKVLNTSTDSDDRQVQGFWNEIERLADCRDAHVLQFYGAAQRGVRPEPHDISHWH